MAVRSTKFIVSFGVALGLAVLIPNLLSDFGEESASPVNPLILVAALGVGLALLLAREPIRGTATAVTLTMAFWFLLYAVLSLHHWRQRVEWVEEIRESQLEFERFSARSRARLLDRVSPDQRESVRKELRDGNTDVRTSKAAAEAHLLARAVDYRNSFAVSLAASLLCAAGAVLAALARRAGPARPEAP